MLSTVLPIIEKSMDDLQDNIKTTPGEAAKVLTDIEADTDNDKFKKAVEVLNHRVACAKAVFFYKDKMAEASHGEGAPT